jgi:hypothetical protein
MKLIQITVLAIVSLLLLNSCSQPFVFRLLNNTSDDILVICYDTKMVPKTHSIKSKGVADIEYASKVVIKDSENSWEYDSVPSLYQSVPRRDYTYGKHGWRFQDIELEPDGSIFLLRPNGDSFSQPKGFPLKPN